MSVGHGVDSIGQFTNKESVEYLLRVQRGRPLFLQPGLSRIGHHDQSSAHHYSIFDYQPSGPAQERKAVVDIAERRHPARWRRDEKGERHERHHEYQESAQRCYLRKPRVEAEHQSVQNDHCTEPVSESVRLVLLIPFDVCRDEGSLRVHMRFVLAGIRVEEAHERAIRDERHDALCLVFEGLQTADPEKDDDETDAGHYNTGAVGPCRDFEDARDHAGHGFESGLSLGDSLVHSQV